MLDRLLQAVLEVGMLLDSLLEELGDLPLEVGLAAESYRVACVLLDESEWSLAFIVACQADSMSDDHLLNEVILCVFDHAKCHNVQESVTVSIGHHRVSTSGSNQLFKGVFVEFGSCDMNRALALSITDEGACLPMLQECIYHKGVASQDGLI